MKHQEFTDEEIEVIKKSIEKYKNFYLPDNNKPLAHLLVTVASICYWIIFFE